MILNETFYGRPIIEEISREKLPDGVLCRVSYPICDIGKRNANTRVYEEAVWERVHEDADLKDNLEHRALFGHAEHPEQTQSNLEKTSHVIFEMWNDGKGQEWQKFDVLDTPTGRIVDCLLRAGCRVGCSTRAKGDLEESEDDEGTFQRVIPESFEYVTTDFTADPSTAGSIPHNIKRNIVTEVKGLLENSKADASEKEFAQLILEAVECKDDKCITTSVKKLVKKVVEKMKENKSISNLIKEGTIKEGATVKYGEKDAKIEKIEEGKVTLLLGDMDPTTVAVDGNAHVNVTPEGFVTILSQEVVSDMQAEEPELAPEAELEVEPEVEVPVEDIPTEDEIADPDNTGVGMPAVDVEDEIPEAKGRLTTENLMVSLGKVVKIQEGEYKDKQGKLTEIKEGAIGITLDDGTVVNIEDPSAINITVVSPPEPEEEVTFEEPVEEEPIAPEEPIEDELGEAKVVTKGGLSDKLADGNLLQDKDGTHWIVTEITNSRLLITQPGEAGTEKSFGWSEVPDWGFTKLAERELEKDIHAVVVREKDGGWGVFLTGDGKDKDRLLTRFDEKDAAIKRAQKVAGDEGAEYKGVEESKLEEAIKVGDIIQIKDKEGNTTPVPEAEVFAVDDNVEGGSAVEITGSDDEDKQEWYNVEDYQIFPLKKADESRADESINETEDTKAMYKAASLPVPDGKGIHTKAFHKLVIEIAKGYKDSGDSGKEALDKAYSTVMKQLGKEKAVKKEHQSESKVDEKQWMLPELNAERKRIINSDIPDIEKLHQLNALWIQATEPELVKKESENESISTTVKEIKNLKIQEASTRSERDKALELLEELTDEKQQFESKIAKDKALEIKMLVTRMGKTLEAKEREVDALRAKLEEKAKFAADQKKLVSEARTISLKGITDLTEAVAIESKVMKDDWAKSDEKHTKEVHQLSEELKLGEKQHKEAVKVLQEKVTKEVTAEVTKQFIKSFVEFRLSESNLKVDENSRALLEKSTSLEDVDNLLDEIVDASRRSALHSEAIRGIRVPKHVVPDPEGDRIKRSVDNVFEGING